MGEVLPPSRPDGRWERPLRWFAMGDNRFHDRWPDWAINLWPDRLLQRVLCRIYGHVPWRDMCGDPEHDHCVWCQLMMPGAAEPMADGTYRTICFDYTLPPGASWQEFEDKVGDWFFAAAEEAGGQCQGGESGPYEALDEQEADRG